jgi:hypothetical protein
VRLELGAEWGPFASSQTLWGAEAQVDGQTVMLVVPARDVTVIALE